VKSKSGCRDGAEEDFVLGTALFGLRLGKQIAVGLTVVLIGFLI
jgi:hypothetical protein